MERGVALSPVTPRLAYRVSGPLPEGAVRLRYPLEGPAVSGVEGP